MDKVATQILELFKHLVRDIFAYLVGGLLIIVNILFIDTQFFNKAFYLYVINYDEYLPVIIVLFSYGLGQLIMGFMYLAIELSGIEKYIKKLPRFKYSSDLEDEIFIFIKNKDAYDFFVERYNYLSYFRWSLAGAGLISFLIDVAALAKYGYNPIIVASSIFMIVTFLIFLLLHYQTDHDFNSRVKILNKVIKNIDKQNKPE